MPEIATTAAAPVKALELSAIVTLGPKSALALGVPEGTQIDYGVLASWHRNPIVRLARKFRPNAPAKADVELAQRHQALVRLAQEG